jgi:predicted transcriptional regulator
MTEVATTHPTRLAEILADEGRRQVWLSERTGISEPMISRYVNGLHVPDPKRVLIADALGRTVADVFGQVRA